VAKPDNGGRYDEFEPLVDRPKRVSNARFRAHVVPPRDRPI